MDKYVSLAPLWKGVDALGVSQLAPAVKRAGLEQVQADTVEKLCGACFQMAAVPTS